MLTARLNLARWRSAGLVALSVAAIACGAGAAAPSDVEPQPEREVAPPPCKSPELAAALAVFGGERCDWVVRREGGSVELISADPKTEGSARGTLPEACTSTPCDFSGRQLDLGPLVVVEQRSPYSEMPANVWLGWVSASGHLAFVDLWDEAGDPVVDQGTEIGPAHALTPVDCGGVLGFQVMPRLESSPGETAPPQLLAREGIYGSGETVAPLPGGSCKPIAWRMP